MPVSSTPFPVERALQRLGADLAQARRRRQWTQQMLAERMGTSLSTVRRMEEGRPGTALEHVARALHAFGELDGLAELLDAAKDSVGLALLDERLPQRVRPRKSVAVTPKQDH